jgi:protein-disulfide isomerase
MLASGAHAADAPLTRQDVQGIVKQYILDHPEVMVQSLQTWQEKQRQQQLAQMGQNIVKFQKDLRHDAYAPVAGNPKGDITIVEFFDYHCGYCKHMLPILTTLLQEDKNIRLVFKEFPILSEDSATAAKASLAFYRLKPSKYFDYYTDLMHYTGAFEISFLTGTAQKYGVSADALKKEMAKPEIEKEIELNHQIANDLGIRGTPAIVIGGQLVPGAIELDELKAKIKQERAARKK